MLSILLGEKIVDQLYLAIPEFEKYALENTDPKFIKNAYLVYDPFGSFLKDWIWKGGPIGLIDRSYSFINSLCETDDKDIKELLRVTFLESMVDTKKVIDLSRSKLKGEALIIFEEVINGPMFDGAKYAK
ncbi:MAG: hypothetical protein V4553_12115 [Bacteroidota bacterium]